MNDPRFSRAPRVLLVCDHLVRYAAGVGEGLRARAPTSRSSPATTPRTSAGTRQSMREEVDSPARRRDAGLVAARAGPRGDACRWPATSPPRCGDSRPTSCTRRTASCTTPAPLGRAAAPAALRGDRARPAPAPGGHRALAAHARHARGAADRGAARVRARRGAAAGAARRRPRAAAADRGRAARDRRARRSPRRRRSRRSCSSVACRATRGSTCSWTRCPASGARCRSAARRRGRRPAPRCGRAARRAGGGAQRAHPRCRGGAACSAARAS